MRFYFPNKPTRIYNPERFVQGLKNTQDWVCQPKWDGKRAEIACENGEVLLRSREGREWSGEKWAWLADLPLPQPWYLDGELTRDNTLRVWDFAVLGGELLFRAPYKERLERLQALLTTPFHFEEQSLYLIDTAPLEGYRGLLAREGDTFLEGLVWKNLTAIDMWGPWSTSVVSSQFKFRFK